MHKLKIKTWKKLDRKRKVYDLEVNKNHNFFIGNQEILTHNCTHILQASQVLLLNMIETYSITTRFILTGNYPERLIPPLRSRLQEFKLVPPSKKIVAKNIIDILTKENIEFELEDLASIVHSAYPDFRKIINSCQKYTIDNKLVLSNKLNIGDDFQKSIIDELKKPTTKTFNNIRQLIVNNDISSFDDIFKYLYENTKEYAVGCEGQIAVILNEHIYQSNFKIDLEINFCSAISRIIDVLKSNKII